MRFPNIEDIRNKTQDVIDKLSPLGDDLVECIEGHEHSQVCQNSQDDSGPFICLLDVYKNSHLQLRKLDQLSALEDYLRDPFKARGRYLLDGLVQKSPVYATKELTVPTEYEELSTVKELRGIYVRFGWRKGPLQHAVSGMAVSVWIAISAVWFGTILWAEQKGDWSTAMGFGQLLAACIALVFLYARD